MIFLRQRQRASSLSVGPTTTTTSKSDCCSSPPPLSQFQFQLTSKQLCVLSFSSLRAFWGPHNGFVLLTWIAKPEIEKWGTWLMLGIWKGKAEMGTHNAFACVPAVLSTTTRNQQQIKTLNSRCDVFFGFAIPPQEVLLEETIKIVSEVGFFFQHPWKTGKS